VSAYQKTNDELQRDVKGLTATIDREQKMRFEAEDRIKQLTEVLEEKKHSEQLAGWAIDRAIESLKLDPASTAQAFSTLINQTPSDAIIKEAQKFCDWIKNSSAQPKQDQNTQETMQ